MKDQKSIIKDRQASTLEAWKKEAVTLFGKDLIDWEFECPSCKESQTLREFKEHGIDNPMNKFYYSCIGRWVNGRGCRYTLGGLIQIHTKEVIDENGKIVPVFEFKKSGS